MSSSYRPCRAGLAGRPSVALLTLLALLTSAAPALARVAGEAHQLFRAHRIVGGVSFTGNTLMTQSVVAPQVNANLLDSSAGDVRDVPFDAELEAAYLFWSGSTDGNPDAQVTLTAVDGFSAAVDAERCVEVDELGGFFSCRADVTNIVGAHPGDDRFNGTYRVGDVQAEPGNVRRNGTCRNANCQAKYAGWSLVLVYRAPRTGTLRDVFVHDGFRYLNEDATPGIAAFDIDGFDFPEGGEATLAFFGLEGDSFLGVPPQDNDPIEPCDTCFDYLAFGGTRLSDAFNPPGNVFNSSSPGGFTLGLDLDRFDVSGLLAPGQNTARIEVGSGDGAPGGGGEAFLLGWVLLDVERNAPDFSRDETILRVVPDEASPRERVVYTLTVSNQGSRDAPNTVVTLDLPAGLIYEAGSLRIDGADPAPGDEVDNPLADGFDLGDLPFRGDTDRQLSLRATVAPGLPPGRQLVATATITADTLDAPQQTNAAVLTIVGVDPLDEVIKTAFEESGDGRFAPGEDIAWEIRIVNTGDRPVGGVRLVDDLPRYVDGVRVFSPSGEDRSDLAAGRVEIVDMVVPPGELTITVQATLHDTARLVGDDGVPADGIAGFPVDNQAVVTAGLEQIPSSPRAGAAPAPTRFTLSPRVDIDNPTTGKSVQDLDGAPARPGDDVRFVITVRNEGADRARVFVDDPLPAALEGCRLTLNWPGLACAGERVQGFVDVDAGAAANVVVLARIRDDAADGARIENVATLQAGDQQLRVRAPALVVEAPVGPDVVATKAVVGVAGVGANRTVSPGRTLTWTIRVINRGDGPTAPLTVVDPLGFEYEAVNPEQGGQYDAVAQTVTWRVDPLAPGASVQLTVATTLPAAVADGTRLSNQARVIGEGPDRLTDDPETGAAGDPTRVTVQSAPLLVLTKTTDQATYEPGEIVTYTLRLRNDGDDTALDVQIRDRLPAGAFAEILPGRAAVNGQSVTFSAPGTPELAALAPGESVQVELQARLLPALDGGQEVANQAFAEWGGDAVASDDPATPRANDPTIFAVEAAPGMLLLKAVGDLNDGEVNPGDQLRYVLTVASTGNAPLRDVVVSDPLPVGLIDVRPGDGGVLVGGRIEWPMIAALNPGERRALGFEATVAELPDGTRISNRAIAASRALAAESDDPRTAAEDATVVTVRSLAELRLIKRVQGQDRAGIRAGEPVRFTLEVANVGSGPALGAVIVDDLPPGIVGPFAVDRVDAQFVGRRLEWRPARVEAGQTLTLNLDARLADAAPLGAAIVNRAEVLDTALFAQATVDVVDRASLSLLKTVDAEPEPGGRVVYTLMVENDGDRPLDAVEIRDPLPAQLAFVGSRPGAGSEGGALFWRLGRLAAGEVRELRLEARVRGGVAPGTVISNRAVGTALDGDQPIAVDSDDPTTPEIDATVFVIAGDAELSISKALLTPIPQGGMPPGEVVEYAITVRNTGVAPAAATTVVDRLDGAFVGNLSSAVDGQLVGGEARWDLDPLAPDEAAVRILRGRLADGDALIDGQQVTNIARLLDADGAELARSEPVHFIVGTGGLRVEKSVQPLSEAGLVRGAPIEYRIEVTNERAVAVADVLVTDLLPDTIIDVQPLDGGALDAENLRIDWTPETTGVLRLLPPGESVTLRLRARIAPDLPPGRGAVNEARARVRGDAAEASGNIGFVVRESGALRVDKQVDPGPTDPGATVGYTVQIINVGEGTAEGVTFVDPLPPGVRYAPGSTSVDGAPVADRGGQAPFLEGLLVGGDRGVAGRLDPGSAVTVRFEVVVTGQRGDEVVNEAMVRAAGEIEGSDRAVFEIGGAPDLSAFTKQFVIVEDPAAERALVGQTIEWLLSVRNTGESDAQDVVVRDPIGRGLRFEDPVIIVDGAPQTAAADGDAAEIVDGTIIARIPRIAVGQVGTVRFRTRVTAGPSVRNQAFARAARGPEQPSDDGGEDGNDPTVVPVGEPPRREVRLTKVADRLPDEVVPAGQAVRFTLRLENAGTVDLSGLELVETLPPGLLFERFDPLPPGSDIVQDGETIRLRPVDLPAGDGLNIVVATRVAPLLPPGTDRVCNRARLEGPGVDPAIDEACIRVAVLDGQLSGAVYEDRDGDGAFTAGGSAVDPVFSGMRVALFRAADPDGVVVAEARTDAQGRYALEAPPGTYEARVFTAADVLMATLEQVVVTPAQASVNNLVIDPSGRVYDSVDGALIDGAEVFIYRDADTDEDPFDPESLAARVLVPPDELEAASQQGQRTANGGLYRFAVRRPGRYMIEVVPPGSSFVSPSVRVPPVPGTAFTDDPDGKVVPDDLPSVEPDADKTYFLAFDLNTADDFFQNNHVPVDPLSSLIDVQKRSRRTSAAVGEIRSFEIDIVNRSPRDLLYDPRSGTGGVYLQDVLPRGLKYVNRTATLVRVRGGTEEPLSAADPEGTRILRFGRLDDVGGERLRRPLDLAAGEHLRLRYHVIVGVDARPRTVLTNRAQLLADGNVPVSRVAEASLRIIADPDFDQGLLLGRVWCDSDENGERGPDEPGLGGVRLYLDNGYLAITDADGRFHFKDIDPGTHAVKIDRAGLLPGAALTTDEVRVIHFTRGLPARVGFGVSCPAETVRGAELALAEEGLQTALASLAERFAVLTGQVDRLRVEYGEAVYEAGSVAVALYVDGKAAPQTDLPAGALGSGAEMEFRITVDARAPRDRWGLYVGPVDGDSIRVAGGDGAPPAAFVWDQKGPDGRALLEPGKAYRYRLEVGGADGAAVGSPEGTFGVGLTQPPAPDLLARFALDGVDDEGELSDELLADLRKALPELKAAAGPLVIEGHFDNTRGAFSARSYTRRKAQAVQEALIELGLDGEALTAEGVGSGRPIAPNYTPRNQRRNRRIDIVYRPPAPAEGAAVPAFEAEPMVRFDSESVQPGANGRFAAVAEVPPEGVVEIHLRRADGARATFPIRIRPGQPRPLAAPRPVLVEGTLPGALTVGGRPAALPMQIPAARSPNRMQPGEAAQFAFTAPGTLDGWRFVVVAPDGETVRTAEGNGPPPASLDWTPDAALAPGLYRYRLTVRSGASLAQSPTAAVRVGEGAPAQVAPLGKWALIVDGQSAPADPSGRFTLTRQVVGETPLLLDARAPDGGRVIFFATPPAAAVAAEDRALDLKSPAPPAAPAAEQPQSSAPPPVGGGGAVPGARVEPRPASTDRPPLPVAAPLVAPSGIPEADEAELEQFGRQALLQALAPILAGGDAAVPARELTVELPAAGSTVGRSVPIRGQTAPGNRVFLNGAEVAVDREGRFAGAAELAPGAGQLEIAAVDGEGNRGVIRRDVVVPDSDWFLLALGEGLTGQIDSRLAGVDDHTHFTVGDQVYVHGRAAAWFKGYMKGADILDGLIDEYRAEVHLDTARKAEFEGAFRQLVDPEQFYPVYGDAADVTKPVNTRGPLYVLLEADDNRARIGNFLTGLEGIELFRYDRALYGAALEIDQPTGDFRHRVTAFAADGDLGQRHAYVELRGTGGSLYYLPHRELIEGSEQLFLVERDRISGIERSRTPLARDLDYTVRYEDGRVLMKQPVPSVTLDSFGARLQPDRGEVLDGHPVYIAVEYDHRDPLAEGDTAVGVRASESFRDIVKVGGGWVREDRGDGNPAYQLWGADLTLRAGRRTRLEAEWARSQSQSAENLRSEDGGLSFEGFNGRDGSRARGDSMLVRGGLELDDLIGEGDRDLWYSEAYWQYIAPGFYAGGTIQEQGLEKYGGLSRFDLGGGHGLFLRHDGVVADAPETQGASVFSAYRRDTTRAGYGYRTESLTLDVELVHTTFEPGVGATDPLGAPEGVVGTAATVSDTLNAGVQYRFAPRWTALLEQELILRSDDRIHDETLDLLTTSVGLRYQIDERLHAEVVETLRWSGANATQIGLRSQIDDRTSVYVQERFTHDDARNGSTTVVGGEQTFGPDGSGRAYGEYQLEYGTLGQRDRAVFGVGKRWKIVEGLAIDGGYERSQVVGGTLGEFSRDAVTLGVEWLDHDRLKVTGRYELRYEDNDEAFERRDRMQFLTLNALSLKLDPDFTALLRFNYSSTTDLGLDATEAELLETSAGLAWRPAAHDWIAVLVKYTKRYEQRPIDVALEQPEREESDVVSLIPIVELPFGFQLVEKLALRRSALRAANLPTVVSTTALWINRLNYHLTETWDAGVEYRVLTSSLSSTTEHGALLELNYILQKRIRLGAGYNFTSFSDDEFAEFDVDYGGPFFRVTAHY